MRSIFAHVVCRRYEFDPKVCRQVQGFAVPGETVVPRGCCRTVGLEIDSRAVVLVPYPGIRLPAPPVASRKAVVVSVAAMAFPVSTSVFLSLARSREFFAGHPRQKGSSSGCFRLVALTAAKCIASRGVSCPRPSFNYRYSRATVSPRLHTQT